MAENLDTANNAELGVPGRMPTRIDRRFTLVLSIDTHCGAIERESGETVCLVQLSNDVSREVLLGSLQRFGSVFCQRGRTQVRRGAQLQDS